MRKGIRGMAAAGAAAMALCGCSALNPGTGAAAAVAEDFQAALSAGDYGRACTMLAPAVLEGLGPECSDALADLGLPAGPSGSGAESRAYGRNAMVTAGDVLFLTMDGNTWKVLAAGCELREEQPATCLLKEA